MTHGEKLLLLWAGLVAAGVAIGWLVQAVRYRFEYLNGRDDGYSEALAEVERNAITATLVEESAGYPDLPARTQVTAAGFDVYRQTHTTYAELAPEVLGALDVPRLDSTTSLGTGPLEARPGHLDRHPDDWGDDTALDAFRQWGTWQEQLAAIDATLGDSPWWTARQREMAA